MGTATEAPEKRSDREPSGREGRLLALLGVPTFGMALAITVVIAYLPKLAKEFTGSTTIIGVIVGGEGLLALWLPLVVGSGRTACELESAAGSRSCSRASR